MKPLIYLFCALGLAGCTGVPKGTTPIQTFELNRYLGTWYEIARLDHSFERGLSHVTATYSLREDGGVRVLNKGFNSEKNTWQQAEGKAYFVENENVGHLKVSFFGPFYGGYVIHELDQESYQYALVSGPNRDYLWILARAPQLSQSTQSHLVNKAAALGFDTNSLIWVEQ